MTLFLMPTVYYIINRRSDERTARAEARRELIAAGLTRKQAKAMAVTAASDAAKAAVPEAPEEEYPYNEETSL
jgi:HAE1 family hydrophobic/amphiphilic exporter-1